MLLLNYVGFSKGRAKGTIVSLVLLLQLFCHGPEESDFYDRRECMTKINMKVKVSLSGYKKLSTPACIWVLERRAQICDAFLLSLHRAGVEVPFCTALLQWQWLNFGWACIVELVLLNLGSEDSNPWLSLV